MTDDPDTEQWKRAAATVAAAEVEDGMVLGLGTGSTADLATEAIARRVAAGLRVVAIPTSEQTAALARALAVPLTTFAETPAIDLTIDGADEIETASLSLIKGMGGALLREKIVAAASRRLVIVADETKCVERLGTRVPLPVEVVAFGWEATARRLEKLGASVTQRMGADGEPFVSDGGNYVLDCGFGPIDAPRALEDRLARMIGVIESGLFVDLASEVVVAGPDGVRRLTRAGAAR